MMNVESRLNEGLDVLIELGMSEVASILQRAPLHSGLYTRAQEYLQDMWSLSRPKKTPVPFTAEEAMVRLMAVTLALPEYFRRGHARGIPESVLRDGMRDIAIWCRTTYEEQGVEGLQQMEWLKRTLTFDLLRLGRLQYQYRIFGKSFEDPEAPRPGDPVLNIHIPEDGSLDPQAVTESFHLAIAHYTDPAPTHFICTSWLLSPELCQVLPADSRIAAFCSRFTPLRVASESAELYKRVWGIRKEEPVPSPEALPRNTRLQRFVAGGLLSGKTFGTTLGYMPVSRLTSESGRI